MNKITTAAARVTEKNPLQNVCWIEYRVLDLQIPRCLPKGSDFLFKFGCRTLIICDSAVKELNANRETKPSENVAPGCLIF